MPVTAVDLREILRGAGGIILAGIAVWLWKRFARGRSGAALPPPSSSAFRARSVQDRVSAGAYIPGTDFVEYARARWRLTLPDPTQYAPGPNFPDPDEVEPAATPGCVGCGARRLRQRRLGPLYLWSCPECRRRWVHWRSFEEERGSAQLAGRNLAYDKVNEIRRASGLPPLQRP